MTTSARDRLSPLSGSPSLPRQSTLSSSHLCLRADCKQELTPRDRLAQAIESIAQGNGRYKFVLLRPAPFDERLIDSGDADLLGSPDSVCELLHFLLEMAVRGDIHMRITCRKAEKHQVTLYSRDFRHTAILDLWNTVPQLRLGKSHLRWKDIARFHTDQTEAVVPLHECVAGAVYLHHLVCRRKPLSADHTRERIRNLADHQCSTPGCPVAHWFESLQHQEQPTPQQLQEADTWLEQQLQIRLTDPEHSVNRNWRPRHRLKRADVICMMGVDGVGKSTLIDSLVKDGSAVSSSFISRKLYRRSWFYRLISRKSRHKGASESEIMTNREIFDERIAPFVYLRSILSLRVLKASRRLLHRGSMILDRSPLDFIYVGRKTEAGGFHPAVTWLQSLAPSCQTIHLVAPHEVTFSRKAEVPESSHVRYDWDMLKHISQRVPCDHLVFNNSGPVGQSTRQLSEYLSRTLGTRGVSTRQ